MAVGTRQGDPHPSRADGDVAGWRLQMDDAAHAIGRRIDPRHRVVEHVGDPYAVRLERNPGEPGRRGHRLHGRRPPGPPDLDAPHIAAARVGAPEGAGTERDRVEAVGLYVDPADDVAAAGLELPDRRGAVGPWPQRPDTPAAYGERAGVDTPAEYPRAVGCRVDARDPSARHDGPDRALASGQLPLGRLRKRLCVPARECDARIR